MSRRVAKLRGSKKLKQLQEVVNEPGFQDEMEWVASSEFNLQTERGQRFINKITPYFRDQHSGLGWTTLERQASKSEMFALMLAVNIALTVSMIHWISVVFTVHMGRVDTSSRSRPG